MTRKIICFSMVREVRKENGKMEDGGSISSLFTNLLLPNWFRMVFCLDGVTKTGEKIPLISEFKVEIDMMMEFRQKISVNS